MYTVEYYLSIKEWNIGVCYKMDGHWKYYAKWNKPVIENHIIFDSIYHLSKHLGPKSIKV